MARIGGRVIGRGHHDQANGDEQHAQGNRDIRGNDHESGRRRVLRQWASEHGAVSVPYRWCARGDRARGHRLPVLRAEASFGANRSDIRCADVRLIADACSRR